MARYYGKIISILPSSLNPVTRSPKNCKFRKIEDRWSVSSDSESVKGVKIRGVRDNLKDRWIFTWFSVIYLTFCDLLDFSGIYLTFSFSNYSSSNETINEKRSLFSMPLLKRPLQEDINSSTESLSPRYQEEKTVQINAKSIKGFAFRESWPWRRNRCTFARYCRIARNRVIQVGRDFFLKIYMTWLFRGILLDFFFKFYSPPRPKERSSTSSQFSFASPLFIQRSTIRRVQLAGHWKTRRHEPGNLLWPSSSTIQINEGEKAQSSR